jgi:prepilin-type N-terminal cleavage/methylation domain-containing protein
LFRFFNLCQKKRDGFTLIEALIAMAVLLVAIVGSVSLITRGLFDFQFSKNKLVAANLAQEGVEIIRAIRENNVLCDGLNGTAQEYKWDRHPSGSGNLGGENYTIDITNTLPMTCPDAPAATITMPQIGGSCGQKLLIDANGVYNYNDGTPTIFSRCVHVCSPPTPGKICWTGSDDDPDGGIPNPHQMDIVSVVTWEERGNTKDITVRERVYDWR